jgi:hypothetical protein
VGWFSVEKALNEMRPWLTADDMVYKAYDLGIVQQVLKLSAA